MNINVLLVFRDLVCSKKRYQSDNKRCFGTISVLFRAISTCILKLFDLYHSQNKNLILDFLNTSTCIYY